MSSIRTCDWPKCWEEPQFSVTVDTLIDDIGMRYGESGSLDMCRKHKGTVEVMAHGGIRFPLPRERAA